MKKGVAVALLVSSFFAGCCTGFRARATPPPEIRPEDMIVIEVFACPKHELLDGASPRGE